MALIPTGRPRSGAPVPAAPARSVLARCALGLRRLRYGVGSITRVAALHLQYPGQVHTEGRVRIDRGCDIRCLPGSTLVLRNITISPGVTLKASPGGLLELDADFIGPGAVIEARESVRIGPGTLIAEHVTIRDGNHDRSQPLRAMAFTSSPVTIGGNVWLGAKCCVLSGVTIGDDATVAAGAVVTRDVAAGETVGGVPARSLRAARSAWERGVAAPAD
ncbi:MAG TPA: acyltransferase [Marmoricola sp.]|nr:acyltransferase [Marmoricola sp.]